MSWRIKDMRFFVLALLNLIFSVLHAQTLKQYITDDDPRIKCIDFSVVLPYGKSRITCIDNPRLIKVRGLIANDKLKSEYKYALINSIKRVRFKVSDKNSVEKGDKTGYSVNIFDNQEKADRKSQWEVFLSKSKEFRLKLNLGLGNSEINLSGLKLRTTLISTASADATINYFNGQENQIEMDSLILRTEIGSVTFNNLQLARAKNLWADIGFGTLKLNYELGNKTISNVHVKIGTGKLLVKVPSKELPVKIKINSSSFATVEIPKGFKKKEGNIYINEYFYESAPNALIFNVDVSLGKVVFVTN